MAVRVCLIAIGAGLAAALATEVRTEPDRPRVPAPPAVETAEQAPQRPRSLLPSPSPDGSATAPAEQTRSRLVRSLEDRPPAPSEPGRDRGQSGATATGALDPTVFGCPRRVLTALLGGAT